MNVGPRIIDFRSTSERWKQHAAAVLKSESTYILAFGTPIATYLVDQWKVMTPDQQTGFLAGLGITSPGTVTAILGAVALAFRFRPPPRGTVSPVAQELLERSAAEQANTQLVAQGLAPVPLPQPKLLAVTHDQIAAVRAQATPSLPRDDTVLAVKDVAHSQDFVETQPSPEALTQAKLTARRSGLLAAIHELAPDLSESEIQEVIASSGPKP